MRIEISAHTLRALRLENARSNVELPEQVLLALRTADVAARKFFREPNARWAECAIADGVGVDGITGGDLCILGTVIVPTEPNPVGTNARIVTSQDSEGRWQVVSATMHVAFQNPDSIMKRFRWGEVEFTKEQLH